jgi:hypothetical protein
MRVDVSFYGKDSQINSLVASIGDRLKVIYGEDTETSLMHIVIAP